MFEVNFNENIDIEENIDNSKIKIGNLKRYLVNILLNVLLVGGTTLLFLLVGYNNTLTGTILKGVSIALGGVGIHNLTGNTYDLISNLVNKTKKKEAKVTLDNVSEVLKTNNVNTNSRELSNSVIIENSYSSTKEVNEDGISSFNEETTEDKYFLFLYKNYNTCGMLERNTKITRDDETNNDRKFYVLEQEDIDKIEHKVVKVKKLVKKPNNIEKKC